MPVSRAPEPEVAYLLRQLVKSQRRTDRWLLILTALIAVLTAVLVVIAVLD